MVCETIINNVVPLLVGFVLGLVADRVKQHHSHRQALNRARFDIYLRLLRLYHYEHFFVRLYENSNAERERITEAGEECKRASWAIADKLREADDLPELPRILEVLFSLKYETESDRAKAIRDVIEELGKKVSPNYANMMNDITEKNNKLVRKEPERFLARGKKVQYP